MRLSGGHPAILPNFFALTRRRVFVTFRPEACPEGAVHEILGDFPDRGRNPVSVRLPALRYRAAALLLPARSLRLRAGSTMRADLQSVSHAMHADIQPLSAADDDN